MGLQIDQEVLAELALLNTGGTESEPPPVGDVTTRRANSKRTVDQLMATRPPITGVAVQHHAVDTDDGATLTLHWYHATTEQPPGSAVLYLHGGGMIFGMRELGGLYDWLTRRYVAASGVPMLLVDYRTAPESAHPVPVHDCFAALEWLHGHAGELGVDPARVAVMGDSAGGALAAAVCLMARDRGGPAIAQQLLVYPMLDDRTALPDPELVPFVTWTYDDNITGWQALLGQSAGAHGVSSYAAPARASDVSRLPPTYIDVGDLDIFRDEDVAYARRLAAAGVPTELHVHPGCPHAFEGMAPNAAVSRRVIADRVRRLQII
ncbi:alpha/beta hydrolase [Mycobacterium kansasii]|uniref:Carboxylesterase NlhH n=1 Tax=Mycobacterium innocens TaxID=2341083 RepID=A0A498PVY5_9MYCO|nr:MULTISPECIES: alpha/beta hydrolase [Mycobacterium]KZS67410.1 alpha/beta hydrolase [Mycobacterium kansasii]VBA37111.1 Carboxylesterase NlhH [Mycobacterium innocens]